MLVIGLDDLIANKRAAGRPQDLMDVAFLERVKSATAPRAEYCFACNSKILTQSARPSLLTSRS